MRAGQLNRRIEVQKPGTIRDEAGQPVDGWIPVGPLMADIGNETGMGAIRSSLQGDAPASIARYSFLVRFSGARALGVDAGMRIVHDGDVFEVKGIARDYRNRDRAFILCEQGGNDG